MNVRIEKVSYDLICSLFQAVKGINGAVGTTDVEKDFHLNEVPVTLNSFQGLFL